MARSIVRINEFSRITLIALSLLALLAFPIGEVAAQDAPSIVGTVSGPDGAAVAAAQVELFRADTEVRTLRATDGQGRYSFTGLEAGVVYTVTVRSTGYRTEVVEEVVLDAGEERRLNIALSPPDFLLEGIDVVVDRRFDTQLSGPVIQITREEVTAHPSTERNFMELARLSPVAVQTSDGGEMSISGQNERHNSILVDGSLNQDVFGASPSGVPGAAARAKPIPLDAIEEFRIEAAPFDVGVSGFTGGAMSALTRRGTNVWQGSFFSEYRNESFFGSLELEGADISPDRFMKYVWGFNVGGPIVHDRVHLFIATEFENRDEPSLGFIRGIHDPIATGVLPDSIDRVATVLRDQYGIEPGVSEQVSLSNPLRNIFTRLDWQLSETNRLTMRHNYSGAARDSTPNRAPTRPYEFSSAGFRAESESHTVTTQLTTDFGSSHANQLTLNLHRIEDRARPESNAPMVDVMLRGTFEDVALRREVRAGSRYFTQQSALDQSILQLTNRTFFDRGDLETTLGVGFDYFSFDHDFRPGSRGYYRFESLQALEAGDPFYYEVLRTEDPGVDFSVFQPHLYFQNQHTFPGGFVLSYGVRMDVPIFRGEPEWNEAVEQEFGLRTDDLPEVRPTFSPRLGFNWQPDTGRRTQLRGTFGVFTANLPYVWMADAIRHTGLGRDVLVCSGASTPAIDPGQPAATECAAGSGQTHNRVVAFRDDFRLPRELKITMALDQELPGRILLTTEALFIPTFSRTAVRDINLPPSRSPGDSQYQNAFGDRAHYGFPLTSGYGADRRVNGFSQVLQIENEKRAALAWSTTVQLERRFDDRLTLTGSVTASRTQDEQSLGFGDMATNLAATPVGRVADQYTARPANFDRPWKYLLSARTAMPERLGGARVSLIYVGQSGQPYSYTYASDINGDSYPGPGIPLDAGNNLLFVPNNPTDIPGSLVTKSLFAQFVNQVEDCLSDVRGVIMERNACRTPMTHMLDLSVAQPLEVAGVRFEITGDLLNILNLMNSEWGRVWEAEPMIPILDFDRRQDAGGFGEEPSPTDPPIVAFTGTRVRDQETGGLRPVLPHTLVVPASQWQAQIGMRIHF